MTLPPLCDVVAQLKGTSIRLNEMDSKISDYIRQLEETFRARGVRRVVSVPFDDGVKLAWSGAKRYWRFVVVDDIDDHVMRLLDAPRDMRAEVFTCGAMTRLIEKMEMSG